jgi:hypothetical protein
LKHGRQDVQEVDEGREEGGKAAQAGAEAG